MNTPAEIQLLNVVCVLSVAVPIAAIAPLGVEGDPAFKKYSEHPVVPWKSPVPHVGNTAKGRRKPFERFEISPLSQPLIP